MNRLRWLVATGIIAVVGCSNGPKTCLVTGAVSWKGEPVAEGQVVFEDASGATLPDAGPIVAGRYEVRVKEGRKTVRIYASREKSVPLGVMNQREREVIVPPAYNAESTLSADVSLRGDNVYDFHLPKD